MNATNISFDQVKSNAKSATLAYAGIYVAAYEVVSDFSENIVAKTKSAQTDFNQKFEDLKTSRSDSFDRLVSRGEKLETEIKAAFDKVSLPEVKLPESLSSIELPKFEAPKFEVPATVSEVIEKVKSRLSK